MLDCPEHIHTSPTRTSETRRLFTASVRPTFDGHRVTVETHILDYSADLYGERLCVELLHFQRPERRFDGAEALRAQISADAAAARAFFEG